MICPSCNHTMTNVYPVVFCTACDLVGLPLFSPNPNEEYKFIRPFFCIILVNPMNNALVIRSSNDEDSIEKLFMDLQSISDYYSIVLYFRYTPYGYFIGDKAWFSRNYTFYTLNSDRGLLLTPERKRLKL